MCIFEKKSPNNLSGSSKLNLLKSEEYAIDPKVQNKSMVGLVFW
jgi:hypothetical protein